MNDADEIQRKLDEIFEFQRIYSFLLTGFHLQSDQLVFAMSRLAKDEPNVGAIGRYRSVPVYGELDLRAQSEREYAIFEGVKYSYVKVDHVR